MKDTAAELELLIRSKYALLLLDTPELERADQLLATIASQQSLLFFSWSRSRGIRRGAQPGDPIIEKTAEPAAALARIPQEGVGVFHFRGLGAFLDDPVVASHVTDVVAHFGNRRGALVISGHGVHLPDSLRPHAVTLELPPPSFNDHRQLLERVIRELSAKMPVRVEITHEERTRLVNNLVGLTHTEAEKVITKLIMEDGALRANDVKRVAEAKRQVVEQDGLLEYWPAEQSLGEVAGLHGFKAWLAKRRAVVHDPQRAAQFGLGFPRGVLLLGVPGCGKSLCAKAVASEWGLPLLKLDPANLYDKYIGDSEKNFKRAMRTAERMAPIVLWIDELEKAFASGGDSDGGVSKRVFGTFLSWLQERQGDVFVMATSNDIAKLPPEFIRKGRFDEVFFVDLPKVAARSEIFRIHLQRRNQDPARFDLPALAQASEGFSGAEIEQVVVGGLYGAFSGNTALDTGALLHEISSTRPLSGTMWERIAELREWASTRTVAAD
ncbi:MAG: AAA family ATPase [Gemmatimonadaceae bacterium]|nr:AAA family ATPase [Gemmatimonadaceae bacterium]MCW5826613.1 AAA family ATPase [Gemmatimonadaceae bacterium]